MWSNAVKSCRVNFHAKGLAAAWACELPATHDLPLSRWSTTDLAREARQSGLVASINSSGSTLWRWLHRDAIRPWYHRSWIFPRDPNFAEKAGRLLDLYAREWQGKPLKDDEFVISADEKTSIQARRRKHATRALTPNDFPDLNTLTERLLDFQYYWEAAAKPFAWKFTRQDLTALLHKLNTPQ